MTCQYCKNIHCEEDCPQSDEEVYRKCKTCERRIRDCYEYCYKCFIKLPIKKKKKHVYEFLDSDSE